MQKPVLCYICTFKCIASIPSTKGGFFSVDRSKFPFELDSVYTCDGQTAFSYSRESFLSMNLKKHKAVAR